MKRLHVHVSVDNLDSSIQFYSGMFGIGPTVVEADYAKWMLEDPSVNFAISHRGAVTGLHHLGIQVDSADELDDMQSRLQSLQPDVEKEKDVACCYARSDKYWVTDPSGIAWESFHTIDSIPVFGEADKTAPTRATCCEPLAKALPQATAGGPCCIPSASGRQASACC